MEVAMARRPLRERHLIPLVVLSVRIVAALTVGLEGLIHLAHASVRSVAS